MARLVYTDQSGGQQILELNAARPQVVIGRHPDCDLITADSAVSRRHCAVSYDAETDTCLLRDLDSANGTAVNEETVKGAMVLKTSDLIRCGALVVQFVSGDIEPGDHFGLEFFPPPGSGNFVDGIPLPTSVELSSLDATSAPDGDDQGQAHALAMLQDKLAEASAKSKELARRVAQLEGELAQRDHRLGSLGLENVELQAEVGVLRQEVQRLRQGRGAWAKSADDT